MFASIQICIKFLNFKRNFIFSKGCSSLHQILQKPNKLLKFNKSNFDNAMHPELNNHYKKSKIAQKNHVFPLSSWESSQKTEEETIQVKLNHKTSVEEPMFKLNNQNKKKKQQCLEPIEDFENLTKIEKRLSYYSTHPDDKRKRREKRRLTLTPSDGMDMY